ncbi:MAG: twin-arginine translocase TatA/TatE family subunit [Phycisphaerae bacterium]|jgi:sec-independent protein translocase protein TatA
MLTIDNTLALIGPLGTPEVVVILLVVLLLFGGKKLPELAKGIGRSLRTFKEEVEGVKQDVHSAMNSDTTPKAPEQPKQPASMPPVPPEDQSKQ